MTSRDALLQSLNNLLCYSVKRDKPDAAENLLAAMEGYFQKAPERTFFDTMQGLEREFMKNLGKVLPQSGSPLKAPEGAYTETRFYGPIGPAPNFGPDRKPDKDPDVAELLAVLNQKWPFELQSADWKAVRDVEWLAIQTAYQRVKAKYD